MASIFLAQIPEEIKGTIYCKARIKEIDSCKNEKVKRQKFYAWALLEKCAESLGFTPHNLSFKKLENGKWVCSDFEFSISHSEDVVAVAIDNKKIGVDIQIDTNINCEVFAKKILTNSEFSLFENLSKEQKHEFLLEKWTQKESVYKMLENKDLKISQINCNNYSIFTKKINLGNTTYYLSCATNEKPIIEFVDI